MKAFGLFTLDTTNHCLWCADERAFLTPKAFDILRYLVEHADRLVTQDELLEALWPATYVNPEGVRKYILEIRKVLGDQPRQPMFIETVPKRGYRFIAALTEANRAAQRDSVVPGTGNMVGREAALSRLGGYFEQAAGGERQVVFITGEAGIGKTTLVDLFQQAAARDPNVRVARGQCIEGFGGKEAYYPMLEALGPLLQDAENSSLVQTLAERAPTWLIQFPALVKPAQRESLQREILGGTRERMVREICEALEAITAQRPLIVILEDLHWVDPSTLDLISAVARRRELARLLLIGTYRPVEVILSQSPLRNLKQDLLLRRLCHEITIESLEEHDVGEYLTRIFSEQSLPSGLANMIHQNSGGNPLVMAAIVQDMVDKGLLVKDGGGLVLTAPPGDVCRGVPETLQQMLEIQLEQLSPEEQRILESGSVAGERFSVWAVAAMLEVSPSSVEDACDRFAARRQFILAAGTHSAQNGRSAPHYEFRHSLYKQVLYRRLSGSNRSRLHKSLADRLAPFCTAEKPELAAELALHFEEGRDHERAAHCLILAAENATRRFSHRHATQILQHALELIHSLAPDARAALEIDIHQRIGDLRYAMGEITDSVVSYEAAAERAARAGLKVAEVNALVRLSFPAWYLDRDRGSEVSRQALAVSVSLEDSLLAAQTQLSIAGFRLLYDRWRDDDREICAAAQETIRRMSGLGVVHDVAYLYVLFLQGHYQEAIEQTHALIDATSNPAVWYLASGAKGIICLFQGRFGEVLRIVSTEKELADKDGGYLWGFIVLEAWLRVICFDYDGVRRLGQMIMPNDSDLHAAHPRAIAALASGYGELLQKRYDDALQCFAQVREGRIAPFFLLHWYWRMQAELGTAEIWLSAGDFTNASREADGFLRSALSTSEPNMQALAWEIKARVAAAEKAFDGAREYIDNALKIIESFDIPLTAWRVHATAWDLCEHEADYERGACHRERAREVITRLAASFEPDEPLRESLLAAPSVRRIMANAAYA
jgi:DNA-binding winged helix-turn-helix (wHTH) protein/tetratricopeptide (TPR) repeat protein